MNLSNYQVPACFDEMFDSECKPREFCQAIYDKLSSMAGSDLQASQQAAEALLYNLGITFTVYGHSKGTEKIWPFDLVPRVIDGQQWQTIEAGLRQRVTALNHFIGDLYNEAHIVKDGIVDQQLIKSSGPYRKQMEGFRPPRNVWCHISGVDLIRDAKGEFLVLEDNVRCPSGVSYVLENREIMKRTFPGVFEGMSVAPVSDYTDKLLDTLISCAPDTAENPTTVLLTPGIYNSAYFEHTFLARKMGIELVQGSDLVVIDDYVYMATTRGLQQVDVIYRRVDDDFLDPKYFNKDSVLGVKGLFDVYLAGNVTLANAPGTGVADDKAVYAYMPQIIEYYLKEKPIINNVRTFLCADPKQCDHVLANIGDLVVKPVNESGGKGIVMGPQSSKKQLDEAADLIRANPRNYIAQPMVQLSTVPTIDGQDLVPRHVDLRPFVLCGEDVYVMPGGLTRVALEEGSMIVNSSQGGGSKDSWVVHS